MIICDVRLLRRLEAERACAYASIGQVDADRILEEIEELRESRGELTMYSGPTIAKAFGIGLRTLTGRCVEGGHGGFQGHLPRLDVGLGRPVVAADWLSACSVNKSNRVYRTWDDPADAIQALRLVHETERFRNSGDGKKGIAQFRLDQAQLGRPLRRRQA